MEDEVICARDIDDCSVCPLYKKDCPGGGLNTKNIQEVALYMPFTKY